MAIRLFSNGSVTVIFVSAVAPFLANGYAMCPEDVEAIGTGEQCEVIVVDREAPVTPARPSAGRKDHA